jgi:hypothetical protein
LIGKGVRIGKLGEGGFIDINGSSRLQLDLASDVMWKYLLLNSRRSSFLGLHRPLDLQPGIAVIQPTEKRP